MSSGIQSFRFGAGKIRILMIDGEPWWIAKDVCYVLELENVATSIAKCSDDEKLIYKLCISGQNREVWLLNESGLYRLIFRSNKKEAEKFRKWVFGEVLPQIRRTGRYSLPSIRETLPGGPGYGLIDEKLAFLEKAVSDIDSNFSALAFTKQSAQELHQEYESKPHSKKHGIHRVKCSFQDLYRVEWLTGFWISTLGASITEKEVVTLAIDALIEKLKLELNGEKPTFALQRTSIPLNPQRIPYDDGGQNG